MGNFTTTDISPLDPRRKAIILAQYQLIINNPAHLLEEKKGILSWPHVFEKPLPGYIINPVFGTCLIWSQQEFLEGNDEKLRLYYLITFVRPVTKDPAKKKAMVVPTGTRVISMDPSKYYVVPAMIDLPDGTSVPYAEAHACIISKFWKSNETSPDPLFSVEVYSVAGGKERMMWTEFLERMKEDPPTAQSEAYRRAYGFFYLTNPGFVSKNMLMTPVNTTEEASKYFITSSPATSSSSEPERVATTISGTPHDDLARLASYRRYQDAVARLPGR